MRRVIARVLTMLGAVTLGGLACEKEDRFLGDRSRGPIPGESLVDATFFPTDGPTDGLTDGPGGELPPSDDLSGVVVPRYGTAEILLQSALVYDGSAGDPNPFTDFDFQAQVTAPSGFTYTVDGFFDGNGYGGMVGKVFKVRIFANEPGTWRWTIDSDVPGLDGLQGNFACLGVITGTFGLGSIVVNPLRPRTFMHSAGQPTHLLAKFLDVAAPPPIQYSHTLLSEELDDGDRQDFLDRHLGMNLNRMDVYLANKGDYDGVSTTPWLGSASNNDKTRFDLARWRTYDLWSKNLRDAGIVAHYWLFADNSSFGSLPSSQKQLLIRYAMARLSPYANTMFCLCLEWEEGWSEAEVEAQSEYLQDHNPWERLHSVHGLPGDFDFPDAEWADYMLLQPGISSSHSGVYQKGLDNRELAAKPLLNEEFCLGEENDTNRRKAWAALMVAGGGSGSGAYLEHLSNYVAQTPMEDLEPAGDLLASGQAYVAADPDQIYIGYLYNGGEVELDLSETSGVFVVSWYDPRSGNFTDGGVVQAGDRRQFEAPTSNDWVLQLARGQVGSVGE